MDIGLLQLSEKRIEHTYLPYTIGLIQAYAQKHAAQPERYQFRVPIFERLSPQKAVDCLKGVDLAAFSVYIWNRNRSLAIAQALKAAQPQTLIVMGGPQIPNQASQAEAFLREHPYVDLLVQGEGEAVFLQILEAWPGNDWAEIPGIAWLDAEGGFQHHVRAERIRDLDSIPSPYLSGVFQPLMAAHPEVKWVATWETNRGCPFSCSFCDWGGFLQSKVYRFSQQRLEQEVEWFGQNQVDSIFCADANFGILPRDTEIVKSVAAAKQQYGAPHLFQTQTAKNVRLRNFEIHRLLVEYALNPIAALSLQSLAPATLTAIRRDNISTEAYRELQAYCLEHGIFSYTDLIIGLPEETLDSFIEGIDHVIAALGQHNKILFHNASILPNAEMGDPAYQQKYGIKTIPLPFPGQQHIDEIKESIDIIVETRTTTALDWVKMQSFAWMTNFLYYTHKLLQVFFLVLHHQTGIRFRTLIEAFCDAESLQAYPLLKSIYAQMFNTAVETVAGSKLIKENPFMFTVQDGVFLTPELMLQQEISRRGLWPQFFKEVAHRTQRLLNQQQLEVDAQLFDDALQLTRGIFFHQYYGSQTVYRSKDMAIEMQQLYLRYNLIEFFESCLHGAPVPLQRQASNFKFLGPRDMSVQGASPWAKTEETPQR